MNDKIDKLLYEAGLTAQGCWDEMDSYDRESILRFGKLVIDECIDAVEHTNMHHAYTTFDKDMVETTIAKSIMSIKERFNL